MPNNKLIGAQAPGYSAPAKSSTDPDAGNRHTWTGGQAAAEANDGDDARATDAALRKAEELGVDLNTVTGSGHDGRITVGDVEAAAAQ